MRNKSSGIGWLKARISKLRDRRAYERQSLHAWGKRMPNITNFIELNPS
jgi:hypothetical protein